MSGKNEKGFGVLMMLILFIGLMIVVAILGWINYNLSDSNQFLKDRIDAKTTEFNQLKNKYGVDKRIYWRNDDAYINEGRIELKKVLNNNELIRLRGEGYY